MNRRRKAAGYPSAATIADGLEDLGYRTELARGRGPSGDMPGLEKAQIYRNADPVIVVVPTGNTQRLIEVEEKLQELGLDWDPAGRMVGGTKYEIHGWADDFGKSSHRTDRGIQSKGNRDNYRIVEEGGRWYVQHKDELGEWWDVNPDGHRSREEAERELEEARDMYSRDLCAKCRHKQADYINGVDEDLILRELVTVAENNGDYYPDDPQGAVLEAKRQLKQRFNEVLERLARKATEEVRESWGPEDINDPLM